MRNAMISIGHLMVLLEIKINKIRNINNNHHLWQDKFIPQTWIWCIRYCYQ